VCQQDVNVMTTEWNQRQGLDTHHVPRRS
jgi:hypothetical protein